MNNDLMGEALLQNQDQHGQDHTKMMEAHLEMQDKTIQAIDGVDKTIEAVLEKSAEEVNVLKSIEKKLDPQEIGDGATFIVKGLKGDRGDKGDKGDTGEKGEKGDKGDKGEKGDSIRGPVGKTGARGPRGEKGDKGESIVGPAGKDGRDGKDGKDGKDVSPELVTRLEKKLKQSEDNLLWINNGAVKSVVAGTNVTVDNTDPQNPIISSTGGTSNTDWFPNKETVEIGETLNIPSGYQLIMDESITDNGGDITVDGDLYVDTEKPDADLSVYVLKAGDTMSGDLDMGHNNITSVGTLSNDTDLTLSSTSANVVVTPGGNQFNLQNSTSDTAIFDLTSIPSGSTTYALPHIAGELLTDADVLMQPGAQIDSNGGDVVNVNNLDVTTIDVGATDTTISRVSAGQIAVEGVNVLMNGGPLGTPSSGTVTNLTGTASININGTVGATTPTTGSFTTVTTSGNIELGNASDTTISRIAAGMLGIEGQVMNGYATTATAAGTTTLTITSPVDQFFTGTSTQTVKLPTTSVVLGQRYRVTNLSTGLVTVQSSGANTIVTIGQNQAADLTAVTATPTAAADWNYEKRNVNIASALGRRITTITSSATPTINTDNCAVVTITALATAITSMTTNLSGTPNNFDELLFRIKDDGTARAITWGASFTSYGPTLPTTTTASKVLTVKFIYDSVAAIWGCVSAMEQP